ncbi:MAG: hypothetical protein JNL10_08035 [Verrucomicrobiales bacterium]|nr:hypothetical protein [Verrucomicrobiales bacterium]
MAPRFWKTSAGSLLWIQILCLAGMLGGLRLGAAGPDELENRALILNGAGAHVTLPAGIFDSLGEFTVEFWIYLESVPKSRLEVQGSCPVDFVIRGERFSVDLEPDHVRVNYNASSNTIHRRLDVPLALPVKDWTHLAFVMGSNSFRILRDGFPMAEGVDSTGGLLRRFPPENFIGMGRYWTAFGLEASKSFDGRLDEIRVWNRVRSDAEIRRDLIRRLKGSEEGLVGLWNFEEGDARDSARSAARGTMSGATILPETLPGVAKPPGPARIHFQPSFVDPQETEAVFLSAESTEDRFPSAKAPWLVVSDPPSEIQLRAWTAAGLTARIPILALRPGTLTNITATLDWPQAVGGRLVALDGRTPLPGVRVELVRAKGSSVSAGAGLAPAPIPSGRSVMDVPCVSLSGTNACVEILSPFSAVPKALTISGWVRWHRFQFFSRFFDLGRSYSALYLVNAAETNTVIFNSESRNGAISSGADGVLETNRWIHLAGVAGPERIQLYVNGVMMWEDRRPGALDVLEGPRRFFLGRSNWRGVLQDPDLDGDIASVSVWESERTQEEIRREIAQGVKGTESGIWAHWDFEAQQEGRISDRSSAGRIAQLVGEAQLTTTRLPVVVSGRISNRDPKARVRPTVTVTDRRGGSRQTYANAEGDYAITLDPGEPVDWFVQSGDRVAYALGFVPSSDRFQQRDWVLGDTESSAGQESPDFPAGDLVGWTMTGPGGEFQFRDLDPGSYQLRIHVPGGRRWLQEGRPLHVRGDASREARRALGALEFRTAPFIHGQWRQYAHRDGLPNDDVNQVAVDGSGLVWIQAGNQLTVYDGNEFRPAPVSEGFPVDCRMQRDRSGALWLGAEGMLGRWDPWARKFRVLTTNEGVPSGPILGVHVGADGELWVMGTNGAARGSMDGLTGATSWTLPEFEPIRMIRSTSGEFWLVTWGSGIYRWNAGQFMDVAPPGAIRRSHLQVLDEDDRGTLWFGGNGGLWRYREGQLEQTISATNRHDTVFDFFSFARSTEGVRWMGTRTGPVFRDDGRSIVKVPLGQQAEDAGVKTHGLAWGADEALWAGTTFGLWRYDPEGVAVFGREDGLPDHQIRALDAGTDGTLWVAMDQGLARWDGRKFERFGPEDGLEGQRFLAVKWVRPDQVWVGGDSGLQLFNGVQFSQVPQGKDTYPSDRVRSISVTPEGAVWFACGVDGLGDNALVRLQNGVFQQFTEAEGLPNHYVHQVECAADGSVWCISAGRLVGWNGDRFQPLGPEQGVPEAHVLALRWVATNQVWLATDRGAFRYDPVAQRSEAVASPATLGVSSVNVGGFGKVSSEAITPDAQGRVWFGTHAGAAVHDGVSWTLVGPHEGLPETPVRSVRQTTNGDLWFGTDQGLVRYRSRVRKIGAPTLTLQADRLYSDLNDLPRLVSGRRVVFQATAVDPRTATERQRFLWSIRRSGDGEASGGAAPRPGTGFLEPGEGPQQAWIPERRGRYQLTVRYVDRDANLSSPATVLVDVAPPWYRDPWIGGPLIVANLGLVVAAVGSTVRSRRRKREADRLRERLFEEERSARRSAEAAQEAAQSANAAKSQFLANVSHELRTPLNAIIGYSEMIREEAPEMGAESLVPDLDRIRSAAKHQLGLINDLLDFSKVEAGRMDLVPAPVDVARWIRELGDMVQPLVARKGNRLAVECDPAIGTIVADATRMTQVLYNLVSNSAKFTENGEIRLVVARVGSDSGNAAPMLRIDVADTGIGMTPEQVGRLFQAFSQADASISKKYGGTGLGLALSRKLCRLMGGDLTVTSEAGRGSIFTVTLPVAPPAATGA